MDTELLVDSQIEDGKLFVEQLIQDGFDVSVALWVKPSDEGLWFPATRRAGGLAELAPRGGGAR